MINLEGLAESLKDVIAFGAENGSHLRFVHYEVSTLDPTTIYVTVNEESYCHGNKEGQRFVIKISHDDRSQSYRWAIKATSCLTGKDVYFDTGSHDMAYAILEREEIKKIVARDFSPLFRDVSLVKARTPWNCKEKPIPEIV